MAITYLIWPFWCTLWPFSLFFRRSSAGDQRTGDYDHEEEIAVDVGGWHLEAEAAEPQVDGREGPPNQVGVENGDGLGAILGRCGPG